MSNRQLVEPMRLGVDDAISQQRRAVTDAAQTSRAQRAYAATLAELTALAKNELVQPNIDIPATVTTALSCLDRVRALSPRIGRLPEIDVSKIAELERYTLALAQAHALCLAEEEPRHSLPKLATRARKLRRLLRDDVRALARRSLLDPAGMTGSAQAGRGYRWLAFELLALCGLLRGTWAELPNGSPVTLREVDEAEVLADQILIALGERRSSERSPAALMRERAFALFLRAYDETRRAVTFLLWREGDVNAVVPSLYTARRRSRRRK